MDEIMNFDGFFETNPPFNITLEIIKIVQLNGEINIPDIIKIIGEKHQKQIYRIIPILEVLEIVSCTTKYRKKVKWCTGEKETEYIQIEKLSEILHSQEIELEEETQFFQKFDSLSDVFI